MRQPPTEQRDACGYQWPVRSRCALAVPSSGLRSLHALVVSLSARRCFNDDKDINDIKDARSICLGRCKPHVLLRTSVKNTLAGLCLARCVGFSCAKHSVTKSATHLIVFIVLKPSWHRTRFAEARSVCLGRNDPRLPWRLRGKTTLAVLRRSRSSFTQKGVVCSLFHAKNTKMKIFLSTAFERTFTPIFTPFAHPRQFQITS